MSREWSKRGRRESVGPSNRANRDNNDVARRPRKLCRYLSTKDRCKYGASCKFSHDSNDAEQGRQSRRRLSSPPVTGEELRQAEMYNNWMYLLRHGNNHHALDMNSMQLQEFWDGATGILDLKSPELHQRLAQNVVEDKWQGVRYVQRTLRITLDEGSWNQCNFCAIKSFLRTVTHPSLLDCLSIDSYVGTLYSLISGVHGDCAVPFFLSLCSGVLHQAEHGHFVPITLNDLNEVLSKSLEVLHQLLVRQRRMCFHESLPGLFQRLDDLFKLRDTSAPASDAHTYNIQISSLDRLRQIVRIATDRLEDSSQIDQAKSPDLLALGSGPSSVYPLEMPTPGGFHDNDHRDIVNITIIPTIQELLSNNPEYLPSTDFRQPHFLDGDPTRRYLDTHFRLLRHDIFGPLKSALSPLLLSNDIVSSIPVLKSDVGVHVYEKAFIRHLDVDKRLGLHLHISFRLPKQLRKKKLDERQLWWENSKRLAPGSLVALVTQNHPEDSSNSRPLLLIISKTCPETKGGKLEDKKSTEGTVVATLAKLRDADLLLSVQTYRKKSRGVLLGIPGLIPATFTPVLENLQKKTRMGELPFQRWIVPNMNAFSGQHVTATAGDTPDGDGLCPPRYSQSADFSFDLSPVLVGDRDEVFTFSTQTASSNDQTLLLRMMKDSTLDCGQCRALLYALTREFALIQGPPGTGKSYLGVKLLQVLLASKEKNELGPIIVVCYTNHALDQFLCHLLDVGVRKIIRIGGQSRTTQLDAYNLRTVSNQIHKTRHENYVIGKTYSDIEEQMDLAGRKLSTINKLRKGGNDIWKVLKGLLQRRHPSIYAQIYHEEIEGFEVVGRDPFEVWVQPEEHINLWSAPPVADEGDDDDVELIIEEIIAKARQNINSLALKERKVFCDDLLDGIEQSEVDRLLLTLENFESLRNNIDNVHHDVNRRALLTADVVGVTTTGLARDASMLHGLHSKIVVCEEAGEVLEAHVVAAMMPGVEHVIQIGDHQQLRPQINNYSLSLESRQGTPYQLDRSQFERVATGQPGLDRVPVAQLDVQRRMRPEIAQLIRPIYPTLQDHGSVSNLPDVVGMRENIFWLNHDYVEDGMAEDGRVKSHSNEWEVSMTKALVRHLVRQGVYKASDISVLTPYSGQLHKLRASLSRDFEISLSGRDEDLLAADGFDLERLGSEGDKTMGKDISGALQKKPLLESLRLATVDNFQGEEAKVIIVSLVRSNPERKVGFLRTVNRINVLLSRAQHGLYLIGSANTYANVPMWVDVRAKLEQIDAVDEALNICCPRHPEKPIRCAQPDDFLMFCPEGGCSLPCEWRLPQCGHQCRARCHSEAMHSAFSCPNPCPRRRSTCDHECPKLCGEDCGDCLKQINGVKLSCGHQKDNVPCYRTKEPANITCEVQTTKQVDECGHFVEVPCHRNVNSPRFHCPTPCTKVLQCGHVCPGTCGTCNVRKEDGTREISHRRCNKTCRRPYNTCNHMCPKKCHSGTDEVCPPCTNQCQVFCAHSRCSLECSSPCAPCIERCTWTCEHRGSCSMPCAAPCDRLPCDKRCSMKLECGHQCPSICGEPCPQGYCQPCSVKTGSTKRDARVDMLEFKTYDEIDLDETPIVKLSCEHFFTAESLDGMVSLGEMYSIDQKTGEFSGLKSPAVVLPMPRCPDCKTPLTQYATRRYNRVVNSAVMDETSKRFLVKGLADLQQVQQHIDGAESRLQQAETSSMMRCSRSTLARRHKDLNAAIILARAFRTRVGDEQQPARKLHDAILEARSRQSLENHLMNLSLTNQQRPVPEHRIILGGRQASIRILDIIIHDLIFLSKRVSESNREEMQQRILASTRTFFVECESLIDEAVAQSLRRYAILASLAYARVAKSMQGSMGGSIVDDSRTEKGRFEKAREILEQALKLCDASFEGLDELKQDVERWLTIFARDRFEEVTKEEIESIKKAMVSGSGGLATHSGHWYKCQNGHFFAIGECGMPMELARCPECGAHIGGQNHRPVDGVSRATELEG